ncbi:MAG: MBL fold metallo-hydrolase [Actinomycetes bacterium]
MIPSFVSLVRADNPGPMTLEGTNTWIVSAPSGALVIDPGPLIQEHLDAVALATDGKVAGIFLTHGHLDHSEGAERFAEMVKAPVFARLPEFTSPEAAPLVDGFQITDGDVSFRVIATPGHTADSLSFFTEKGSHTGLFTGDTILGRGSSIVAYPDGSVGPYLASLRELSEMLGSRSAVPLLPGHGPVHDSSLPVVDQYLHHRLERVAEVRAAMARGIIDVEAITDAVYVGLPENLKWAALLSVQAQVAYVNENA